MKLKREKRQKLNKAALFSILLFALLIAWLLISLGNAGSAAEQSRSDSVYRTVMNSASLCYSIEGEYPPDIEYLEENYGVKIDSRYIVHYEYFGANIRPSITVSDRKGKAE